MRLVAAGGLLLALGAVGSLMASPLPLVSLSSVGLLVAAALYTAYSAAGKGPRPPHKVLAPALLGFASAFLLFALLTTQWPAFKLPWLAPVYGLLGNLRGLVPAALEFNINANQTGGVAAVMFALAAGLTIFEGRDGGLRLRFAAAGVASASMGLVILTGSRAALAAAGVALLLLLALKSRRWLWTTGAVLALLTAAILLWPGLLSRSVDIFLHDETLDTKLVARLDIWLSAIRGIEDHAVTGIGLGAFNEVIPVRYPYESVGLAYSVSQAHNIFLDTALNLGLPGLLGLLLLLAGMFRRGLRSRHPSSPSRPLVLGLLAATTGFVVFGLTDGLSFSTPFSLVLWVSAITLSVLDPSQELET